MKNIKIVVLFLLLVSCSQSDNCMLKDGNVLIIDMESDSLERNDKYGWHDYFSDVLPIPLENKIEYILNFPQLIPIKNGFCLWSNTPKPNVLIFDEKGNFSNYIGAHGHGHGEYVYIESIIYDKENNMLLVLQPGAIISKFDVNGTFVDKKQLNQSKYFTMGTSFKDGYIFTGNHYSREDDDDSLLFIYDKNLNLKKRIISANKEYYIGGYGIEGNNFYSDESNVIYFDEYKNQLYKISLKDYSYEEYCLKFDNPYSFEQYKNRTISRELRENIQTMFCDGNTFGGWSVLGNNDLLNKYIYKFDIKSGKVFTVNWTGGFYPKQISYYDGNYYGIVSTENAEYIKNEQISPSSPDYEDLRNKFLQIENQENFVIVKMKANPNFPERQL